MEEFPAAVAMCSLCGLPVWLVSCEELVSPVTEDGVLGVLASLVSLIYANSSSFKSNKGAVNFVTPKKIIQRGGRV